MPFTLAHSAAALPFRRTRLLTSALVIGTFAPDFEYFLRLAPDDGFGHTLLGTLVLTLPAALLVLWMFQKFVKAAVIKLLPEVVQRRLSVRLIEFRFGGPARWLLITISILAGIATHLLWDSFTHPGTWIYRHWPLLRQTILLPVAGPTPFYKVFQHGSTIIGVAALVAWFENWYRRTHASTEPDRGAAAGKAATAGLMTVVALVNGIVRAIVGVGLPSDHLAIKKFVGEAIVTAIALAWWQLVGYGVFLRHNSRASLEETCIGAPSD